MARAWSCGTGGERARCEARERLERAARRRAARGAARARPPSPPGRSASARASSSGPVSRPSSISMVVTPVSVSPFAIAHWIGAAPRSRGRSEAWTLTVPRGAMSITLRGRIWPKATTTCSSGREPAQRLLRLGLAHAARAAARACRARSATGFDLRGERAPGPRPLLAVGLGHEGRAPRGRRRASASRLRDREGPAAEEDDAHAATPPSPPAPACGACASSGRASAGRGGRRTAGRRCGRSRGRTRGRAARSPRRRARCPSGSRPAHDDAGRARGGAGVAGDREAAFLVLLLALALDDLRVHEPDQLLRVLADREVDHDHAAAARRSAAPRGRCPGAAYIVATMSSKSAWIAVVDALDRGARARAGRGRRTSRSVGWA